MFKQSISLTNFQPMGQLMNLLHIVTHIGVKREMPVHERERIIKLNKLYLLTIPACIMGSVWSFDSPLFIMISMSICLFMQFCLLFHYLGWYSFANFYGNFIFNALCSLLAIAFNGKTGTENYLFVAIFTIQLQYYKSKGYARILLSLNVFILFTLVKIVNSWEHPHLYIPKYYFVILVQNTITVFFLLMYLMHEYLSLIQNYESEIEKQNQNLANQKAELIVSNQIKDQLFSIIGHDLNKPLASIKGIMMLISNKLLSEEEQAKYLHKLNTLLDSTDLTLKNLLDWGLSHNKMIQTEPFLIYPDAHQNIQLLEEIARQKKICIINNLEKEAKVFADRHHFSFILRNLIANAIKFTPEGGNIWVSASEKGNQWEVSVRDTGVGIKASHLDKLFNLEKRFTTLGTAKENGTGLGLPLCKQFVEENSGVLSIYSEEGKGSTFSFTLPKSS